MSIDLPNAKPNASQPQGRWQQGELLEIEIHDLTDQGDGVGRWSESADPPAGQRVVFVPDTVPGDRLWVRLVHIKPTYAYGKLYELLQPSPHRRRPACIVADKCGGCQWQQIDYAYQLTTKQNLVTQALERIGGFDHPPVENILALPHPWAYRNKATYPLGRSKTQQIQAGYYQKGSHQLINLNQCPIQDERLNPLLAEIKLDIQDQGWSIYDETTHRGLLRHLALRIGRRTGEQLLTLVACSDHIPYLERQAQDWMKRYPDLVGVNLNLNPQKTNAIFGAKTVAIAGQSYLEEEFAGLRFQIQPTTFFQVYTEQAEQLLEVILSQLNLQGDELLLDAYSGVGTLTLPLARQVRAAIGLEIQAEAVAQAQQNAQLNQITNVTFQVGSVEQLLPQMSLSANISPDVVILDPPRKGCDRKVIEALITLQPQQIVYVSCNPATLARDLKQLCQEKTYQLVQVQPADFFPHTPHVESVSFLRRIS